MKLKEKPLGLSKETIIANLTKDSIRELEKCRAQIRNMEDTLEWMKTDNNRMAGDLQRALDRIHELEPVVISQACKLYLWDKSRG